MNSREQDAPGGRAFWILTALGLGVSGFGLAGLLRNSAMTHPANWARFFLGALIAHDLFLAPAVGIGSLLLARVLPDAVRSVVQGAIVVSGAVVIVSIPVLDGAGRNPNNPSILPHDYGHDLLIVLAAIWAVTGALLAWRRIRRADPRRTG
jgi:hypothetical protein